VFGDTLSSSTSDAIATLVSY